MTSTRTPAVPAVQAKAKAGRSSRNVYAYSNGEGHSSHIRRGDDACLAFHAAHAAVQGFGFRSLSFYPSVAPVGGVVRIAVGAL